MSSEVLRAVQEENLVAFHVLLGNKLWEVRAEGKGSAQRERDTGECRGFSLYWSA